MMFCWGHPQCLWTRFSPFFDKLITVFQSPQLYIEQIHQSIQLIINNMFTVNSARVNEKGKTILFQVEHRGFVEESFRILLNNLVDRKSVLLSTSLFHCIRDHEFSIEEQIVSITSPRISL